MKLFKVPVSVTSKEQALAVVTEWMKARLKNGEKLKVKIIVTPNPEIIVAAQKNPKLLVALQKADLSIADGWGVAIAAKVQRISGITLMETLVKEAAQKKWRVMLVGGKFGVAKKAATIFLQKLEIRNLSLEIMGIQGPSDIFHCSPKEMDKLISHINYFKPDLLFVAFGPGRQEIWMNEWRPQLHVGVMMGVGGALDQIVDPTLRPPSYIDDIGFGWFYRLIRQPWRLGRQLALVRFATMVIKEKFKQLYFAP